MTEPPYFGTSGSAAGTPDEGWYSFDLAAWHLISAELELHDRPL